MVTTEIRRIYKHTHARAFTVLARLLALVLLVVGTAEFVPVLVFHDLMESIHLWHIAELGALAAILLGGTLFILSYNPDGRPLLAQFFLLSAVVLVIGTVPFNSKGVGLLAVAALFVVLYPSPRALLSFRREGAPSFALLGLTAVYAVFLIPVAWHTLHLQITGMTIDDPHAQNLHWIGSTMLVVLLLLAGVLTATKRPGWKVLGVLTGEAYCYLGVMAMLVPDYPGSWGVGGGFCAAVGGGLYILLTLAIAEAQKERASQQRPAQKAVISEKIVENVSDDEQNTSTVPQWLSVSETLAVNATVETEERELVGMR